MVVVVNSIEAPSIYPARRALVVPDGTKRSSLSARCQALIDEFRTFGSKTFDNLLGLGKTVVAAKVELPPKEYNYFCTQVGFKPDSPTLRKFEAIGRNAPRFEALADRMPNRWTTLYLIASLTSDQLELLTDHQDFGPTITAQMVRKIVFPKPEKVEENKAEAFDWRKIPLEPERLDSLTMSFTKVEISDRQLLVAEIEKLQERFRFRFIWQTDRGIAFQDPPENLGQDLPKDGDADVSAGA